MLALLWTQFALASHPCTHSSMVLTADHASLAGPGEPAPEPCQPAPQADESALCESHCGRSELSPDTARLLCVPALGPVSVPPVASVQRQPDPPVLAPSPGPLWSWHRPTAHPANLLLI